MLGSAGTIADVLYYSGVCICLAAVGTGITWAILVFIRSARPVPLAAAPPAESEVEDRLLEQLRKKDDQTLQP